MDPSHHGSVLLVEDDDAIRDAVADIFDDEGFDVVAAANGREAVQQLAAGPVPCAILLDLMMPVMDGWQFCHWLRRQPGPLGKTPVILLSASPRLPEAAATLGVHAQLTKPLSIDSLLGAVSDLCPRRRRAAPEDPDLRAA